jgi:hypothetical protein
VDQLERLLRVKQSEVKGQKQAREQEKHSVDQEERKTLDKGTKVKEPNASRTKLDKELSGINSLNSDANGSKRPDSSKPNKKVY